MLDLAMPLSDWTLVLTRFAIIIQVFIFSYLMSAQHLYMTKLYKGKGKFGKDKIIKRNVISNNINIHLLIFYLIAIDMTIFYLNRCLLFSGRANVWGEEILS